MRKSWLYLLTRSPRAGAPVVLGEPILDRYDRVLVAQALVTLDQLGRRQCDPLAFQSVSTAVEQLGRRHIQRQRHLVAGLVAGAFDRADDDLERCTIVGQAWREAAFVADAGAQLAVLQLGAQRLIDLGPPPQR